MQLFGVAVVAHPDAGRLLGLALLVTPAPRARRASGLLLLGGRLRRRPALASLLPATDRWPLPTGLGGVVGDALLSLPRHLFGHSEPLTDDPGRRSSRASRS